MKRYFIVRRLWFMVACMFAHFSIAQAPLKKPVVPKLVVGIVVDQMRYDYIYKYWNKFGEEGFKRMVNEGFFCRNTNFNYVPTYTGPGHASIYTGTTPSVHGIISNQWYSREKAAMVYCAYDKSVEPVGTQSPSGKMSPVNMLSTTVGDELRLSNNMRSKVIGISLKDRSSILPAGHAANAAYWLDKSSGNWITSSHYMKALPKWVNDFNSKELVKNYLSKPWTTLLLPDQYTESVADDNKYEGKFSGEAAPVFPHNLPALMAANGGLGLIASTPFGNSITKDFSIETMKAEGLGKGEFTDFIAISFSSTDYIGHQYGTNAVETEDTYLRLDKDLAELLKFIDTHVGKNNALVFLTADHGAVDNANFLIDSKIPAGYINSNRAEDSLKAKLFKQYGDSIVLSYSNQQVYLNYKIFERKKVNSPALEKMVADFMLTTKGVSSVVTATALKNNYFPSGINHLIQNGYSQKRSGDVAVNYEPGWVEYEKEGTTHGAPYTYDTHVPLIWYGFNVKSGSSDESFNITDIAPTISLLLNLPFPNGCTGKPIQQITGSK